MRVRVVVMMAFLFAPWLAAAQSPARVTVIYDAFGKPSPLKRGWGYAALIEYGGRRILFDTGGQGEDFARNVKTLGLDLTLRGRGDRAQVVASPPSPPRLSRMPVSAWMFLKRR